MRRFAVVSLLIITTSLPTVSSTAIAQEEYAQATGVLDLELSVVLTLSGNGSVDESVVFLSLVVNDTVAGRNEFIDLGTLTADSTGALSGSVPLQIETEAGPITVGVAGLDLALAMQQIRPGLQLTLSVILTLSGDGFVGDSVVLVSLTTDGTDESIDLGTLATDSTGAFSGSVALPEGVGISAITLTATGVTEDGATRVLSAELSTAAFAPTTTTTTPPSSTTSITSAATTTTSTTEAAPLPESVSRALLAGLAAVRDVAGS